MTPTEQYEFIVASLREGGYPEIAAIAYPGEAKVNSWPFGAAFAWEQLGRCPSLREVKAVVKARRLMNDAMGCPEWPFNPDQNANFWHQTIETLFTEGASIVRPGRARQ